MSIDPALESAVNELAEALMQSAERDQYERYFDLYAELEALAQDAEDNRRTHPYLLETLDDFTLDDDDAIDLYERALELSDTLGLPECRASIQLAIADRYIELGDGAAARSYADAAAQSLERVPDEVLQGELAELRQSLP